ncbi:hypothetical protein AB0L85_00795 [Streptomyces sp. NPDC052051]|uniref:hypothetical protein n=1 Tax=Streptomyces sp. NPDC052051 TaxID=3154649 RepID=UPI003439315E
MSGIEIPRLLPWTGLEGKACYLITDGSGRLSRMADTAERVQLGMAGDLLGHAVDMLADDRATSVQLRYLLAGMHRSLTDVLRIAESRGARLLAFEYDDLEEHEDEEGACNCPSPR